MHGWERSKTRLGHKIENEHGREGLGKEERLDQESRNQQERKLELNVLG